MYSWALNTRWAVTEKESKNLSFFCYLSLKGKGRGLMLQAVNIKTIKCTRHHISSTDLCEDGCRRHLLSKMSERKKRECCTISDLTRHQIMRRIKSKNRCCHLLNPLLPQFSVDKKSFTSILLCIFHVLAPPSSSPFNFQFPGSIPQPCPPPPAPPSSSPSHSPSPSNPPSLPSIFLHASGFNKIQILSILPT